ncbi:DUF445 domain-containing protein [Heliobacterium mobile]|uniref:DUF445 domain-containing protein n=1 Tax=Heliobacterium mobile TaxID=28064 RepID=UPI0014781CD9|nr:DUF445 domain-containing protein [Heliobacterium mobile]
MSNRHKATFLLFVAFVGFLGSYPFHESFAGGLIASTCSAALIGGLADWFAVTALFRKPLGIPFRTEIIPRNRERIFEALIHMVEGELLTKANLKEQLNRFDLTELLFRHLSDAQQAGDLTRFVSTKVTQWSEHPKAVEVMEDAMKIIFMEVPLAPVLADHIESALDKGHAGRLVDLAVDELKDLIGHPAVTPEVIRLIKEAKQNYESGMKRRRFFNESILGMTPETLAVRLQKDMENFLAGIHDADHPLRLRLLQRIQEWAEDLRRDPVRQQKVEEWKKRLIERLHLRPMLEEVIQGVRSYKNSAADEEPKWLKLLRSRFLKLLAEWKGDKEQRQGLDRIIKEFLFLWIDEKHGELGKLVEENLQRISNDELVELIESKAGNDLQMIRINGSIVGGFVGLLIFLLTFWMP